MKTRIGLLLACFLIAGCGGGGGSTSTPGTPVSVTPPGGTPQYANLTIKFAAPPATSGVQRQYVSPNAAKIVVLVNTVNGSAPPSWVPASTTTSFVFSGAGQNCTVSGGTATCTISVAAPPGSVNYTFTVEDSSNNPLGTVTVTETIVQGTNNTINVTLGGVVATVVISGPTLVANVPQSSAALTVTPKDATGAIIVGAANYNNPITLTENNLSGGVTLSVNGGTAAASVVSNSPSDAITLNYSGQATNSFTITASGTGITGTGTIASTVNDVTFTGTTLDDAAHGGLNSDPNWGQATLFFSQASGSQNITAAEIGFSNAPYSKQFDAALDPSCIGVATISAGPATSFTVTAAGAPGICSGRFTEHGTGYPLTNHPANVSGSPTHDGTFWISVTTSSFTVNGKKGK